MVQASVEKFKQTGPAEKKRVASVPYREQLASKPEPSFPKRKKQCRLSTPDRKGRIQYRRSEESRDEYFSAEE